MVSLEGAILPEGLNAPSQPSVITGYLSQLHLQDQVKGGQTKRQNSKQSLDYFEGLSIEHYKLQ
jgi:hypothetical protein